MRDCLNCTVQNRQCIFADDWESCQTCKDFGNDQCDGILDLADISLANTHLSAAEKEAMQLLARLRQDVATLKTLGADIKMKQANSSAWKASHAEEEENLEHFKSEIHRMVSNGRQLFTEYKTNLTVYNKSLETVKGLREHAEKLFQEIHLQVHHRTINDCFECQDTGKACAFSDESEQCFQCQSSPRRRCQGSVDDEDTDRMKVALENLDAQIEQLLSCESHRPDQYHSLKTQLEQAKEVMRGYKQYPNPTPQQCADYTRRLTNLRRAEKELEEYRNESMIDDSSYQELRIRRRLVYECYLELLQRGVFYYDELEELAGNPERRGHKSAEHMNHDEFRAAVESASEASTERLEFPVYATTLSEGITEDDTWDSGIET